MTDEYMYILPYCHIDKDGYVHKDADYSNVTFYDTLGESYMHVYREYRKNAIRDVIIGTRSQMHLMTYAKIEGDYLKYDMEDIFIRFSYCRFKLDLVIDDGDDKILIKQHYRDTLDGFYHCVNGKEYWGSQYEKVGPDLYQVILTQEQSGRSYAIKLTYFPKTKNYWVNGDMNGSGYTLGKRPSCVWNRKRDND